MVTPQNEINEGKGYISNARGAAVGGTINDFEYFFKKPLTWSVLPWCVYFQQIHLLNYSF